MKVLGVDPGLSGAFVLTDGKSFECWPMPIITTGKDRTIDFSGISKLLCALPDVPIFLERAIPFALGAKQAFNYGRGFEALVIAIMLSGLSVTYVEPAKWTKEMHEGISSDLKPKVKSLIAVKRLHPQLVKLLPSDKKGVPKDGAIDALLIASYGLRRLGHFQPKCDIGDFY